MTTTPLDYFDKVPGTLEQLVLAVITQKLINRDYIHESLRTDFTSNAISWNITADSGDNLSVDSVLSLSLTFPSVPFERQILTDAESFDKRIMSINSLSGDTLSLPQKTAYPVKSFPAQLPPYLDLDVPENILERRLIALCLHVRNYLNWIDRWNIIAAQWIFAAYSTYFNTNPNISYNEYRTLPITEIEALRDELLIELAIGVNYKPMPLLNIKAVLPVTSSVVGNPGTAQELLEFFNNPDEPGVTPSGEPNEAFDPASNSSSPLSSTLLNDLIEAAKTNESSNSFSPGSLDPQNNTPTEKPTLPNC